MADYIKFRLTAARVGVSMALMALIAGIAEKVQASSPEVHATPASLNFSKITSSNLVPAVQSVNKKVIKLNTALLKVENGLARNYLKIRSANASFLKVTDANANFLKITDATAQFLKISDANLKFLKMDGTAANSALLGNLRPDQFFQGRGNILSSEVTLNAGQQALMGDGSVRVLVGLDPAGQPSVTLENDTSSSLNFTLIGGRAGSSSIPSGQQVAITPTQGQMDIQLFGGGGGAGKIWTLTISALSGQGGQTFVGQMLIGLL